MVSSYEKCLALTSNFIWKLSSTNWYHKGRNCWGFWDPTRRQLCRRLIQLDNQRVYLTLYCSLKWGSNKLDEKILVLISWEWLTNCINNDKFNEYYGGITGGYTYCLLYPEGSNKLNEKILVLILWEWLNYSNNNNNFKFNELFPVVGIKHHTYLLQTWSASLCESS